MKKVTLYRKALNEVRMTMGPPCKDNKCLGCRHEMEGALAIIGKALGDDVAEAPIHKKTYYGILGKKRKGNR